MKFLIKYLLTPTLSKGIEIIGFLYHNNRDYIEVTAQIYRINERSYITINFNALIKNIAFLVGLVANFILNDAQHEPSTSWDLIKIDASLSFGYFCFRPIIQKQI